MHDFTFIYIDIVLEIAIVMTKRIKSYKILRRGFWVTLLMSLRWKKSEHI